MNSNEEIGGYGLQFISMGTKQLIEMRDKCGIEVVQEQVYWHDIEKTRGSYDWSLPDKQVNRVINAGLRLILCAPITVPMCLPNDWYWRTQAGWITNSGLSFWHEEAQQYELDFIKRLIDRYSDSNINIIYHGFLGGESVMPNYPSFYDPEAIKDFKSRYGKDAIPAHGPANTPKSPQAISFSLDANTKSWLRDAVVKHHLFMQEPFKNRSNEVWDDLQPVIGNQSEANGNFAQYDIHTAYKDKWPDTEQWLLMYTYFGNGQWSADQIEKLRNDFDCKVIVEANYVEGLRDDPHTYDLAIEKGFQGQIVCPLHPFREHKIMEPWMFEQIKIANNKWKMEEK
jgi:hypothetical protein